MHKTDILNFLREHKKELQTNFGIQEIALFGSCARDEQREDSDIDLLIVSIDKILLNSIFDKSSHRLKGTYIHFFI